jgi:hypothetical protein
MYPKEENKTKRVAFWTAYGKHMERHRSLRGPKVSWLNYKTGIKHIYFRQDADERCARVSIDIQHNDPSLREVFYDQFWELETLLHQTSGAVWTWNRHHFLESGQEISRISIELKGVNMFEPADWPKIFKFLENHMLSLDEIWVNAVDIFKDLES